MDEALKKITSYQIFNFLLTGTIFAFAVSKSTPINLIYDNILIDVLIYYFIGLILSRVGSLVVAPILKKIKVVVYAPYKDYLKAQKIDSKIDTLSQENNMYRTFVAVGLIYLIVYLVCFFFKDAISTHSFASTIVFASLLIIMFVFSYRKQTSFITKRVNSVLEK